MRSLLLAAGLVCLSMVVMTGCGGHEGGVVDVPLNENPYQISEQEQRAMNAKIDETSGLSEEEIEELEKAKQEALEQEAAAAAGAPAE
ncbi:hypothetical protein [Planctomycetes bacterium TBK1r]|uniref:Secreted protein n=1 Tax=Stieleria magnilauensis TaxID=2527963 RepID=A0ABX5XPM4_9BACT|nr:hypothetical protein TBK1r_29050 [Planctomycetes bacterium TBK1r]